MQIDQLMLGKIAGAISAFGFVPYIRAILKNKSDPRIASWIIWTITGLVLLLSYQDSSDDSSVWVPATYVAGPALVWFILDRRARKVGAKREEWPDVDKKSLKAGLFLLIPWLPFKAAEVMEIVPSWGWIIPAVTLVGGLLIEFCGALPSIKNAWRNPESEDFFAYVCWCIANALNACAVTDWNWKNVVFHTYMLVIPICCVAPPLVVNKWRKLRQKIVAWWNLHLHH